MEDTESEDQLWGAINISNWQETPCIVGRVATEGDATKGFAVFFMAPSENQTVSPIDIRIPRCAILHEEDASTPVVVVQAELGWNGEAESRLIGYRQLGGGNGICMFDEVELLDGPDERFFS
jgi:hypothetical protein